jgi:predicted DNA-binding transcriptional regulator YafY
MVDEALALIVSYEALLRYPNSPFSAQSLSAVTKLRAALPQDVVAQLDRLRRHVAVVEPVREEYEAPLLGELLEASLEEVHLKVAYDSIRSGVSERVVFPFGLYASQGFWYCACFDHKREANVTLRADRFLCAERVEGLERPPHVALESWIHTVQSGGGERLKLRAYVTERGAKSFELVSLFGRIEADGEEADGRRSSGMIEAEIPRSEIDFYASRLLNVGTDVKVESPPELVEAMRNKAREIARLYG